MIRYIILMSLFAGISLTALHAQHDVLSAGGDFSSSGGSVAFSIGQVTYTNFSAESGNISLGVQQPYFFSIVGTEDLANDWAVSLYPNPANEQVFIDLKDDRIFKKYNQLAIHLFDIQGHELAQKEIKEIITSFPLTTLTDAVYILQISQDQQLLKSFKLYKSN